MPLTVARVEAELDQVYCPFSGKAIQDDDGEIAKLPSLLFVYYGNAGLYAYVSEQFLGFVKEANLECEDGLPADGPEEIAPKLDVKTAFLLEVDAGRNGVNAYGFVVPQ